MTRQRPTILVVEDDEHARSAYRTMLETDGWDVEEAGSGEEALRQAQRHAPLVALMDISIPGIDGWETTRRLKEDAATRTMAVIAITGHALDEDRRRAREVGCDVYLVKPVDPQRLLEEVRRFAPRR